MNDSGMAGSCSVEDPNLQALCTNITAHNMVHCQNFATVSFLLNSECYINRIFYPLTGLFIAIGTVLNLISFYCFLKTKKRDSQNIYLCVLSLGDTINLHINFALPLLRKFDHLDSNFRKTDFLCRIIGVLTEFFLIFPTWIVVLLTMERLISVSCPSKRRSSDTQKRAQISIIILAALVLILSLYRLFDFKGIDQLSAFSITACDAEGHSIEWMRNLNLVIWSILPECLTFLMSLIIIYQIKSVARRIPLSHFVSCQSKYNQATRTVLLISILFVIFHTPTGIMTALALHYSQKKTLGIVIILVSRKFTMLLYEINLSCKFFIYTQTFRNFKGILCTSMFQFTRRANSGKLGRPVHVDADVCSSHQKIHFHSYKQSITSPTSHSDAYGKTAEEYQQVLNNRQQRRTNSTRLSRINRERQSLAVVMDKTMDEVHVALTRRSDLARRYSKERK